MVIVDDVGSSRAELEQERARSAKLQDRLEELESAASQLETYAADLSRTYSELRRHLSHMTILHEVSMRIASALDTTEVLDSFLESLGQIITYDQSAVYLLDLAITAPTVGRGTVVPSATLPRLRASRPPRELEAPNSPPAIVARAMRLQQTISGRPPAGGGQAELAVPLRAGGWTLGALVVQPQSPITEEDVKVVELLAAGAAVAIQNAHLYQETQRLATIDPLTGLSNRRHFDELLSLEVERARRMSYPVGFLMVDLDHFRLINERHLHAGGDEVLRRVAEVLRGRLRRTDVVGRVGGEEFGAILPGASIDEVAIVAEKIRHAVEELRTPIAGSGELVQVTVSAGGASLDGREINVDRLMGCADQALYEAKRRGRNQIMLWTEDSLLPDTLRATHYTVKDED